MALAKRDAMIRLLSAESLSSVVTIPKSLSGVCCVEYDSHRANKNVVG